MVLGYSGSEVSAFGTGWLGVVTAEPVEGAPACRETFGRVLLVRWEYLRAREGPDEVRNLMEDRGTLRSSAQVLSD